ncbi:MAG: YraN family protein [Propionibacteriaceae bacterium]|jgi:putative endonuclease|nr:YraN family protein [Propionibacteriaceae bacterium]
MNSRQAIGALGEQLAVDYVAALGWEVVDRNWRSGRLGELDLVALEAEPKSVLVFCEVKTRSGLGFGRPTEAVTRDKLRRLRRLAWAWLGDHQRRAESLRVDVIGVLLRPGQPALVDHVRGAEL